MAPAIEVSPYAFLAANPDCCWNSRWAFPRLTGETLEMASQTRPETLTHQEARALNASAFAAEDFEPFVSRIVEGEVLDKMIARGLVEAGPSCRPAVGNIGYRLTAKGWVKFNRAGSRQVEPGRNGS